MQVHRVLAHELTAALGPPNIQGERHTWHLGKGGRKVNVVLELPAKSSDARLWIFDPRRGGPERARSFVVENVEGIPEVLAAIAAIPTPYPER